MTDWLTRNASFGNTTSSRSLFENSEPFHSQPWPIMSLELASTGRSGNIQDDVGTL